MEEELRVVELPREDRREERLRRAELAEVHVDPRADDRGEPVEEHGAGPETPSGAMITSLRKLLNLPNFAGLVIVLSPETPSGAAKPVSFLQESMTPRYAVFSKKLHTGMLDHVQRVVNFFSFSQCQQRRKRCRVVRQEARVFRQRFCFCGEMWAFWNFHAHSEMPSVEILRFGGGLESARNFRASWNLRLMQLARFGRGDARLRELPRLEEVVLIHVPLASQFKF